MHTHWSENGVQTSNQHCIKVDCKCGNFALTEFDAILEALTI
jgi:hypothetical protein